MNHKNFVSFFALVSYGLCAIAQETEYTDLYYTPDFNTDGYNNGRYMQNPANWNVGSIDGPVFEGTVNSSSNNLFLVASTPITTDQMTLFGYDIYKWNLHDVNLNIGLGNNYRPFCLVESQSLTIGGDLNVTLKSNVWDWMPEGRIALHDNTSLVVEGNLNFTNPITGGEVGESGPGRSGVELTVSPNGTGMAPATFEVKGNIVFNSADTYSYSSDKMMFTTTATNFKVGGYIDMTEVRSGTYTWDLCNTSFTGYFSDISIGGLEGGSGMRISSSGGATVNLTFANSVAHSFAGTFAIREGIENRLNITMDASDVQNGSQTLIIKEGGTASTDYEKVVPGTLESVTVKNGTLTFGTYSGMANGSLNLSGDNGKLAITSDTGSGIGTIVFDTALFERGTIEFTIVEEGSDKIEITSELSKFGNGKINIEFDADSHDIYEWILASGGESIEYELITFGETSGFKDGDFIAEDLGGKVLASLFLRDNALVAQFTAVPEPAALAAVFGALALALALRRRR